MLKNKEIKISDLLSSKEKKPFLALWNLSTSILSGKGSTRKERKEISKKLYKLHDEILGNIGERIIKDLPAKINNKEYELLKMWLEKQISETKELIEVCNKSGVPHANQLNSGIIKGYENILKLIRGEPI